MNTLLRVLIITILWSDILVKGQKCDPSTGPAGQAECVHFEDYYDDYQWAVCLTNTYIQLKSNKEHICRPLPSGDRPNYCWYQCQIETFGLDKGTVYDECRCTPGGSLPTFKPLPDDNGDTGLPEWCLSPSGTECTWYRECLEKRHPCEASGNGYALSYAEKFCNLYTQRSKYFSALGLEWVNAVRKCLQVALVPHIRPWSKPTCQELKKIAFDSHTPCYLEPFPGAPSICDLGCLDWAQIFWTIKSGYTQAFVESLQGTVDVMLGCGKKFTLLGNGCPTVIVRLVLIRKLIRLGKRSIDQGLVLNNLAGSVADELATKLKWDKRVMDWYAYAPNNTNNRDIESDKVEVEVLFGDKMALDLSDKEASNVQPDFDLENTVKNFADAVEKGLLHDMVIGNEKVSVKSLTACQDMHCEETFLDVTASPPRHNLSNCNYGSILMTFIITMITLVVLQKI